MLGNVGLGELLVILIISILVVGPKRTVEIARTLGRISRQLRDLSREFTNALQAEIDATESETGDIGSELRQVAEEFRGVLSGARGEFEVVEKEAAEMSADLGQVARQAHSTMSGAGAVETTPRALPAGGPQGAEKAAVVVGTGEPEVVETAGGSASDDGRNPGVDVGSAPETENGTEVG